MNELLTFIKKGDSINTDLKTNSKHERSITMLTKSLSFLTILFVFSLVSAVQADNYGREWRQDRQYVESTFGKTQKVTRVRTETHVRRVYDSCGNLVSEKIQTQTSTHPVARTGYSGRTGFSHQTKQDCEPRRNGCYSVPRPSGTSVRIGVKTNDFGFQIGVRSR